MTEIGERETLDAIRSGAIPIPPPPDAVAPAPAADPAVEALRARYAAGVMSEAEVDAEIRRLALARAVRDEPDGATPPGPIPLGRFISALGAFCDAYMTYRPGGDLP